MFVRPIITGGSIDSIIQGLSNGKVRNYLIVDKPRNELERLAYFANKKIETGDSAYLKINYDWEFGQRARVLEVVTRKDAIVTIYKFVSIKNFDQHALDLERIKESICLQGLIAKDNLKICLVTTTPELSERIKELLAEMEIDCDAENI